MATLSIPAIETSYKGHVFRSRLEARWAVFFDAMGIKYLYENDGFDLDGRWYLPDFFIPDWDSFIEIKPPGPGVEEVRLCDLLAEKTGKDCLLIAGSPWRGEYQVQAFPDHEDLGLFWEFLKCRRCDGLWLSGGDENPGFASSLGSHPDRCGDRYPVESEILHAAYRAARSERFPK